MKIDEADEIDEPGAGACCTLPGGLIHTSSWARGSRSLAPPAPPVHRKAASMSFGTLASLGVAFFPKCPVCWAAYLSMLGVAGLERIPYSPWLLPVLAAVMLINLASVWRRGRTTGRMSGFYLVSAGVLAIAAAKLGVAWKDAATWGVALTLAGSLLSALSTRKVRRAH